MIALLHTPLFFTWQIAVSKWIITIILKHTRTHIPFCARLWWGNTWLSSPGDQKSIHWVNVTYVCTTMNVLCSEPKSWMRSPYAWCSVCGNFVSRKKRTRSNTNNQRHPPPFFRCPSPSSLPCPPTQYASRAVIQIYYLCIFKLHTST